MHKKLIPFFITTTAIFKRSQKEFSTLNMFFSLCIPRIRFLTRKFIVSQLKELYGNQIFHLCNTWEIFYAFNRCWISLYMHSRFYLFWSSSHTIKNQLETIVIIREFMEFQNFSEMWFNFFFLTLKYKILP